jgi:hypothetical protein
MPADYEASRQRDARFARRFTFTVAAFWLTLHAAAAAVYSSTNNPAPLGVLIMLDGAAAGVGGALWLSGRIFR